MRPRDVTRSAVLVVLLVLSASVARVGWAQSLGQPTRPRYADVQARPVGIGVGRSGTVTVVVTVKPGFHVQANPASEELVPTTLTLEPAPGLTLGTPVYPKSKPYRLEGVGELAVYDGTFEIKVPVTVGKTVPLGQRALKGSVRYQACDDTTCFFPVTEPVMVTVTIGTTGAAGVPQKK